MLKRTLIALSLSLLATCALASTQTPDPASDDSVRFATFNTSLNSDAAGGLIARLDAGDANARKIAAVIQQVRPDVLLLNEFDFDPEEQAANLFQHNYLGVAQADQPAIAYPYHFSAAVNTGVPSGLDLNRDGRADGPDDAWGFGNHPGQYGMLILSRYPIDTSAIRTFQQLRWCELPGALAPVDPATGHAFYAKDVWQKLRLSSKSHWDVPITTPLGTVHFLVAHPTPPVFDGPEDRNGLRNHDEIRLWAEYLSGTTQTWLRDDQGRAGGLSDAAAFVIAGDLNADPDDGDGYQHPVRLLLQHPRVNAQFVPQSTGAPLQAAAYGLPRQGDSRAHTGNFGPHAGTLRIDYVLPSRQFTVRDGGVFWPSPEQTGHAWIDASDHHLVWLDLTLSHPAQE